MTQNWLLTMETANELLDQCITEKGADYVYPDSEKVADENTIESCVYVNRDGSPSCLIGHMLHKFGIPTSRITEFEGECADDVVTHLGIKMDPFVPNLLIQAQGEQDSGRPWGEAVRYAREHVADLIEENEVEEW